MKTGFIGLGIMGRPISKNLLKAGISLLVSDLNPDAVADVAACGAQASTNREIAENCDVIFLCVPKGTISKQIILGEGGIAELAKEGTIVCDLSSVTPAESRACADGLRAKGMRFMDAPVSGGEPGAIDGTLAIMCGGEEDVFEALQPYFNAIGSSSTLVGPTGIGSVTKLVNQMIVNNTFAVLGEAFVFAVKAGADPEKVYHAIRGGMAASTCLDQKAEKVLTRDFTPGGSLIINFKDIKNVVAAAHELEIPIPYTAQLYEILQVLSLHGHIGDDHSGIIQYFEQLAGVEVKRGANS